MLALLLVLPRAPMNFPLTKVSAKGDLEESPEAMRLAAKESIRELCLQLNTARRLELVRKMVGPFMLPLMVAMMARAVLYPGIARALPQTPAFQTFFAFSTSYGLVFQLGNFVGRTFSPLLRVRSTGVLFSMLGAATAAVVLNAVFILSPSVLGAGLVVLCGGVLSGALYTVVYGRVVGDKTAKSAVEKEFCLQVVGAGETGGLGVGGVLAAVLEEAICRVEVADGGRWCSSTR
jgi:battenin